MMKTTTPPLIQLGARLASGERPWMGPLLTGGGIAVSYLLLRYSWAAIGLGDVDDMQGLLGAIAIIATVGALVGVLVGWAAAVILAMRCRRARRAWAELSPQEQRYAVKMQDPDFRVVLDRLDAAGAGMRSER
jgi:hypothetical protein